MGLATEKVNTCQNIWGRLKSMTSQSEEEDQEEINFTLAPFSSFRYQRREKVVHLTLKRERTSM